MRNKTFLLKSLMLLVLMNIYGCVTAKNNNERIGVIEYQELAAQNSQIKNSDKKALLSYNKLIERANELIDSEAFSVVNKTGMPPSKDKHDYMSIGPYWWPNPETDDGLPYIRKDGEINPEARNNYTDFVENQSFLRAIKDLNNAYYLSDNLNYGKRALEFINVWFLNPETKMNPHLNYGQSIPGKNDGRCFGIIEFGGITEVVKFLELAKDNNLLDKTTEEGMFKWLTAYVNWLQNSKLGIEESTRENNHGTHYDVQLLSILLYLNRIDEVKTHLSTITKARIFSQIEPDGSQPKELKRTKSFSYSVMNLHGFLQLARLGQKVGVNLWDVESEDGRSIKKGYQYMLPYLTNEKKWEYKQIIDREHSEEKLISDLKSVDKWFNDTSFDEVLQLINEKNKLETGFQNPPQESKPRTWYHINSSNASKEGFTKDLKAIKEAGIGGVLVFNVSMGLPEGDVAYNSQEHRDILAHAAKECEKLGLSFGVHNCDGWTSSGGPWVTPEHAMKVVVNSQVIKKGGKAINIKLPQPPARHNYYKDIAVVAYPTLETELIDDTVNPIITSSDKSFNVALATDKQTNTHANLKAKTWVQYDYGKAHTIRSMNVFINKRKGRLTLLKSDDGINFTVAHKPREERIGKDECYFYESFKPVTARYFRIETEMDAGIYEMQLSASPVLGNIMEYTSYRKNRRPIGNTAAETFIKKEDILILSDKMDANGVLKTTLAEGNWTIMRFGFTASGATNEPSSVEGKGLEVDKFSKKALKVHYDAFVGKLVEQAKLDAPNALQYVEIDSYEVGPQNWTNDMEQLFQERFGYDFTPFLLMYAGKSIENNETVESVFWDMKQLVSDLMVTNYFDYFTELCHQDGLISYIEPYGFVGPFNSLDAGKSADIPMGEFWLGKPNKHKRAAVSSGHIYGKNVISAEAFTSTKLNWSFHPALAKQKGDYEWTNGINEYMFHRFAHQSNTHVKPGMSMSFVGSHIDRTQTWWDNAGPEWFNYLARGSYMLRQGNPVLDVLVFVGDRAPSHVIHANQMRPKLPAAYKYDCVNSDVIINRLSVENGKLKLPNGITYNALSLQRNDIINLETLRGIHKLSQKGALIVGKKPKKLGGYNISKEMETEFDTLVNAIWSSEKTYSSGEWEQIFETNTIQKDLIVEGQPDFNYYHRRTENEDIYFVYNHNLIEKKVLNCSFLVDGKVPELWNAETGEITKLVEYTTKNGRTNISIPMHPQESVFVVFKPAEANQPKVTFRSVNKASKPTFSLDDENNLQAEVYANGNYTAKVNDAEDWTINVSDIPSQVEIKGNWEINFRAEDFHEASIKTDELFDWTTSKVEEIKHYSGTAIYTITFNIEKEMLQSDRQFQLNLGEVSVIAKVLVNGKDVGVSWIAPHALNVTTALKAGENTLEIQVTNQWTNRLIGDEKLPNQTEYDVRRSKKGFGSEDYRGKYKKMPDWYRNNQPLPEGPRKTFSAYSFQKATDDLLPSGLLGPVTISSSKIIKRK